ncbi:MAG: amidohydrolase family protein [Salinivirgaceae bacterium]|nr:amidohydrolase family protein [Salinivirgaceae bacterium]
MIILKDATFIDWKTLEFKQGHVIVEEGVNKAIQIVDELPQNFPGKIIDCKGKYVTKSFGCGHHHVYSALATGMPTPRKIPGNFYEILKYVWWTLDKSLDLDMIKASAYVTAIACAKNGVTFAIDHHASPFAVEGSLQTIADAFNEVGVGHLLCYEISDRDGVNIANKGLEESKNYLQNNQGLVGLHASFTLTNKTLKKAADLAKEFSTGVHVHVAEDIYDQEHCYDIHNKRVIERFRDYGILDLPKSLLVHCLYLTDEERHLIRNSGVYVAQNAESNLNNNVGQFNSCALGNNIMLGTDGMHSDMLRAAKATFYNGQASDTIDYPEIYRRFRNVHNYLNDNNFVGDGDNNLVVLDYQPQTDFNQQNFLGHFLFGMDSAQVQHVISNGKLIVENKIVTTVNEADVKMYARELSKKLWGKMNEVAV